MEPKRLNLKDKQFVANGISYYIGERLSLDRWTEFEKQQPKLGFGKDFQSIFNSLSTAIDYGNKGKGIEAWNIVLNLKQSVNDHLENRMDTALYICALFINRKDENQKTVDKNLFEEKINDWRVEGYDSLDFFSLAANLVSGFIQASQETSQNISKEIRSKQSKHSENLK